MTNARYVTASGVTVLVHRRRGGPERVPLGLGPAKDTKRVLIEIRAAEIAHAMSQLGPPPPKSFFTKDEILGWMLEVWSLGDDYPPSGSPSGFVAGWLARRISGTLVIKQIGRKF